MMMDKSNDLTVTWSGGVAGQDYAIISGASYVGIPGFSLVGAAFVCTERIEAGTFTVPAAIIATLPTASSSAQLAVGIGQFLAGHGFPTSGLDSAYFTSMYATAKDVGQK